MSNLSWRDKVLAGDLQGFEDDLTNVAVQKVRNEYIAEQLNAHGRAVEQRIGDIAKYVKLGATEKVQADFNSGKIQTPQDLANRYEFYMNEGAKEFEEKVKPGHARQGVGVSDGSGNYVMLNNYPPPSDTEVTDYINARKSRQNELREEAKRINTLPYR